MPKVRIWSENENVTRCNTWARLYFDPGRSRLMLDDGFVDFSAMRDRAYAMAWCQANGVEFWDHRSLLLPEGLRYRVISARAAGSGELRELVSRWRLIPLGRGHKLFIPQLAEVPSWRAAKANRPNRTPSDYPAPRWWRCPRTGQRYHAFTCACYDCHRSRSERTA